MPKLEAKTFRIDVHIYKLQAKCNTNLTRARATALLDAQRVQFKEHPQVKRNMANFTTHNSFDSIRMLYDPEDGLYEDRYMTIEVQFITMGNPIRIGEVTVNLGKILNSKKFLVPAVYPLGNCYDKSATLKLSVGFQVLRQQKKPLERIKIQTEEKQQMEALQAKTPKDKIRRQQFTKSQKALKSQTQKMQKSRLYGSKLHQYNQSQITVEQRKNVIYQISEAKQRFRAQRAEEQNKLLNQKLYQLKQQIQQMRQSHTSIVEKFNQDVWKKDQRNQMLETEIKKLSDLISEKQKQYEYLNISNKRLFNTHQSVVEEKNSSRISYQKIFSQNQILGKQVSNLKSQIQALQKKIQSKDRHYKQEQQKYTERFIQSENQKNLVILQMEARLKEQKQKGQRNVREAVRTHEQKFSQSSHSFREKITKLQQQNYEQAVIIQQLKSQNKELINSKDDLKIQFLEVQKELKVITQKYNSLQKKHEISASQLDLVPITLTGKEGQIKKLRQQSKQKSLNIQQLHYQLRLANQTIAQDNKKLSKYRNQIQMLKQKEHYLKQKFEEQIGYQNQQTDFLKENSDGFQLEIVKLKSQLKISADKLTQEIDKVHSWQQMVRNLEDQLQKSKENSRYLEQQKISANNEIDRLQDELFEKQQAIQKLHEQNIHMQRYLVYKNQNVSQTQEQLTAQFSGRIDLLQSQIRVLLTKQKEEKKEWQASSKYQMDKVKRQLQQAMAKLKKQQQDFQDFKLKSTHIFIEHAEYTKILEQLKEKNMNKNQQYSKLHLNHQELIKEHQQILEKHQSAVAQISIIEKDKEDLNNRIISLKTRNSNLKTSFTKFLITMMDKISHRKLSALQIVTDMDTTLQQEIDAQVINYMNVAVRKNSETKEYLFQKVKQLEDQRDELALTVDRLKLQLQFGVNNSSILDNSITEQIRAKVNDLRISSRVKNGHNNHGNACNYPQHLDMGYKIEELKSNINKLERQISQLKSKSYDIIDQKEKFKDLAQSNASKSAKLKRQLDQVSQLIGNWQTNSKTYKQRILNLQEANKELRQRVQIYQKKDLDIRKNKIHSFQQKTGEFAVVQKNLYDAENKNAELKATLDQTVKNLKLQKQKGQFLSKKIAQLSESAKQKDSRILCIENERINLQSQMNKLKGKLAMQKNIVNMEKQKSQSAEQFGKQLKKLRGEKQKLLFEINQARNQIQILHGQLKQKQAQFKKSLKQKDEQISKLRSQIETKKLQQQKDILNWQSAIYERDRRIQFLQKKLQKLKEEMVQFSEKYQQASQVAMNLQEKYDYSKQNQGKYQKMLRQLHGQMNQKQVQFQENKFVFQSKIMQLERKITQLNRISPPVFSFRQVPQRNF